MGRWVGGEVGRWVGRLVFGWMCVFCRMDGRAGLRIAKSKSLVLGGCMGRWMDGWMAGWWSRFKDCLQP